MASKDTIEFELKYLDFKVEGEARRDGYAYLGEGCRGAAFLDLDEGELIIALGWAGETRGNPRYVYKFTEDELRTLREICRPYGWPAVKKNYLSVFELKVF